MFGRFRRETAYASANIPKSVEKNRPEKALCSETTAMRDRRTLHRDRVLFLGFSSFSFVRSSIPSLRKVKVSMFGH